MWKRKLILILKLFRGVVCVHTFFVLIWLSAWSYENDSVFLHLESRLIQTKMILI